MDLRLYDTLTREKRLFTPLDPARVRMYVCGPTVYDFAHIGNARPVIVFDVLFRLLRHLYGTEHVTYVRNITDVDDKINARAAERIAARGEAGADLNAEIRVLTEETYANFKQDVAALGCLPPTFEPRATEYISRADGRDMITLIAALIRNGNAYEVEGHVLFHVPSMPDYGALSKRPLDEMEAGARIEVAPYKRDPMDFVLWKPSKPGEPGWDSPWGRGRPGWHIECSAMSAALLGKEFDIHGGGIDLVFPHHENEIAQSRCAFHTPFMAKFWMHNGFLQVEGEKMSKSLGNFVTIRELLPEWPGEVVRFNMLKTHYRQPIDWTEKGLGESFDSYFDFLDVCEEHIPSTPDGTFIDCLLDDLNTPEAIARLHELRTAAVKGDIDAGAALTASLNFIGLATQTRESGILMPKLSQGGAKEDVFEAVMSLFPRNYPLGRAINVIKTQLKDLDDEIALVLGLLKFADAEARVGDAMRLDGEIETINEKIDLRLQARKIRNFKESDRIRDELAAMGVVLKDSKDGTTWEVAR